MAENVALEVIDRQEWLEPVADRVQETVTGLYESAGEPGRKVKNFLHGTWLGHPLHSAVTDVPLGAWTAAVVMDAMEEITGREEFGKGADAAVAIGLAGAVVSAVTGITDWSATDGRARKVGMTHAMLNTAGALLFGTSLAMRKNGSRGPARGLSAMGYVASMAAAYLGGHLAYSEQIGVDHTIGQNPPEEFKAVLPEAALGEGEMRRVDVEGCRVLVARRDGKVYAITEVCSHLGGPLAEGEFEDDCVTCPWHGSRFSVKDGSVVDGPTTHPQRRLEVRINGGQIEVRAYSEAGTAK